MAVPSDGSELEATIAVDWQVGRRRGLAERFVISGQGLVLSEGAREQEGRRQSPLGLGAKPCRVAVTS